MYDTIQKRRSAPEHLQLCRAAILVTSRTTARSGSPPRGPAVFYLAAQAESVYTENAKTLHAASTASSDAQLMITTGGEHGVSVVMPAVGTDEAIAAFHAFLAKHAPVR